MVASCESVVPALLPIFNQIKQHVAQGEQRLAIIQSPAQKHSEEQKAINTRLDAAWNRVFQIQDLSERRRVQEEIEGYVSKSERLEISYKAGLTDAEAEYKRQVDDLVKDVCTKLGESIITALGSDIFRGLRVPASGGVYQDKRNDSQNSGQQSLEGSEEQSTRRVQNEETLKRRQNRDTLDQRKRQKLADIQTSKQKKKSIRFEEVFQDGNAPIRHIIVQWPPNHNSWYIVRCEKHELYLKDNPLVGGAAHLRGKKHNKKPSDHNTVIELLGTRVLGCTADLAERNNHATRDAFKNGYSHPTKEREDKEEQAKATPESNDRRVSCRNGHQRQNDMPAAITAPTYGQVYRVYWKLSKQWLAALLLPMGNLEDIGIPGSIEELGLLEDLPQCYSYDSQSKSFSWKEGYEDDGSQVSMREFPVMFFDGSPFPSKSSVAWVGATDLQSYDVNARNLIEHNQQVLDYLESQRSAERQEINSEAEMSDSFSPNLIDEPAQSPRSSTPSTSGNQDVPSDFHPDSDATPATHPIMNTENTTTNHEISEPAIQTTHDISSIQGSSDESPREQVLETGDSLQQEPVTDSYQCVAQPNLPPVREQGGGSDITTINSKENGPQPTQQQPIDIDRGRSLSELEVATVAQTALDMANKRAFAANGPPMNQAHVLQSVPSVRRQQQPTIPSRMSGVPANQTSTRITNQKSPLVNFPQPGFSSRPYTQLPPIRPLEEGNAPHVQGWPNGASMSPMSPIDNTRAWAGTSTNTQPPSHFGVLKPPGVAFPERQTRFITENPAVPIRQAPVGTAAPQSNTWLSGFPPSPGG